LRESLEVPDELFDELCRVTGALGLTNSTAAAAIASPTGWRGAKRNSTTATLISATFINEALDELAQEELTRSPASA